MKCCTADLRGARLVLHLRSSLHCVCFQASKTWLSIAEAQSFVNSDYETVMESYEKAYKLAKEAQKRTLQVTTRDDSQII